MNITTFDELLKLSNKENKHIYSIMENNEAAFLEISIPGFRNNVLNILNTMKQAIKNGLNSKELSKSGLSGENANILTNTQKNLPDFSLLSPIQKKAILYSISTIEENARMGKIAACPTAGSSGIVPGVLIALFEAFDLDDDTLINALITAGSIGKIISNKMALAGAVAGCQAECGTAAAMAAGAAVYILCVQNNETDIKNINEKILNAAALSLKNILGLTCDPVAGLVEIPCVKRNAFMTMHAITAAELSMSGIISKIPPDEIVDAMKETGELMAVSLKESSEAGLAKTKTGVSIENTLRARFNI